MMKTEKTFCTHKATELKCAEELRILLTQRCNFHCPFCHRDGTHCENSATRSAEEWMRSIIQPAIALGIRKVTFSGGEPLCAQATLIQLLQRLAHLPAEQRPRVKLITNGYRLGEEVIRALLDYPVPPSIHVSFHAADRGTYNKLTGNRENSRCQQTVVANIVRAVNAGLAVKLNAVIVRGFNDAPDQFMALLHLAHQLQVAGVQFIPFEGRRGDPFFDARFVPPHELEKLLLRCPGISRLGEEGRKIWFRREGDQRLLISITRCTCHMGCRSCLVYRPIVIDAELRHHPCRIPIPPGRGIAVGPSRDFFQTVKEGEEIIRRQIRIYGTASPVTVCTREEERDGQT